MGNVAVWFLYWNESYGMGCNDFISIVMPVFNPLLSQETYAVRKAMVNRMYSLQMAEYRGSLTVAESKEMDSMFYCPLYLSSFKTPDELKGHLLHLLEDDENLYQQFIVDAVRYEIYEFAAVAVDVLEDLKIQKLIEDGTI